MIEVREVKTKKEQKEFIEFPLKLYKGNPYFVPPLYGDEKKLFRADYGYYDQCEAVYYNAYQDGRMAGRICGILQKAANEKNHEKRIRFCRFDAIDDPAVSKALFDKVEEWGRAKGMDTIVGPLGFSDLEREGLLIEGFDELSTFEEQYNFPYYQTHIEALGYEKEVDWLEHQIRVTPEQCESLMHLCEMIQNRFHLHWGEAKNTKEYLRKYKDDFFRILDLSYTDIYGTVPFTENMQKMLMENFNLIIKKEDIFIMCNEKNEAIAMGICFASLSKALQPSGGRLTPAALVRVLKAIRKPKIIDFGLIGVDPKYANCGIGACAAAYMAKRLLNDKIEYAETNLNLEDNYAILNLWKRFDARQHKKRRAYVKKLV